MPSNFTAQFQKPSTDVSMQPVAPLDVSGNIVAFGQAAGSLIKGAVANKQAKQDASTMGAAQDALNQTQAQEANYYEEMRKLSSAIAAGDANQVTEMRQRFDLIQQGKVSGVLTPVQATLQINDLVKQMTVAAPHLAKEFRSVANEAKGNIRAAAAEMFQEDPFAQQDKEDIKQAVAHNVTVEQWRAMQYRKTQADDGQLAVEQMVRSGIANAETAHRTIYQAVTKDAPVIADQINTVLTSMLNQADPTTGQKIPVTNDDLKAGLDTLKMQYMNALKQGIAKSQIEGNFSLSKEQRDSITEVYESVFKNAESTIAAYGTPDNIAKRLELDNKMAMASGVHSWILQNQDNPFAILSMGDPQTMSDFAEQDLAARGKLSAFMAKQPGITEREAIDTLLRKATGDPKESAALMRLKMGYSTVSLTNGYQRMMQGQPPDTGTKAEDAAATSVTLTGYDHSKYETRMRLTDNLARALPWEDMFKSKTLAGDIKNSPSATSIAVDKATWVSIPLLGIPGTPTEMEVDFTNPDNPISYVKPIAKPGTYLPGGKEDPYSAQLQGRGNAIPDLNKTYRAIRDNLGLGPAQTWLKSLEERGVLPVGSPFSETGGTRKAVKLSAPAGTVDWLSDANKPKGGSGEVAPSTSVELMSLVAKEATAQEIDPSIAHAIAYVESDGGKLLRNPTSSARGPMHIIEDTFNGVNEQMFGGSLKWDDVRDQTKASVGYLKMLSKKYTDPRLVFAAYFLGEPAVDPAFARGGIDSVMALHPPGKNMTLRDYINEAMARAGSR